MQKLKVQVEHFQEVQIQLQTFEDDDLYIDLHEPPKPTQQKDMGLDLKIKPNEYDTENIVKELEDLKAQQQEIQLAENVQKKMPPFDLSLNNKRPPGLPALDFSNLKHVREADWYAQCKKLEDEIIPNLRAKVEKCEEEISALQM